MFYPAHENTPGNGLSLCPKPVSARLDRAVCPLTHNPERASVALSRPSTPVEILLKGLLSSLAAYRSAAENSKPSLFRTYIRDLMVAPQESLASWEYPQASSAPARYRSRHDRTRFPAQVLARNRDGFEQAFGFRPISTVCIGHDHCIASGPLRIFGVGKR